MKIHDDDDISTLSLCKMCPFLELFSPNAGKYGPE